MRVRSWGGWWQTHSEDRNLRNVYPLLDDHRIVKSFLLFLLTLIGASALANDGWVGYTGAPRIEGKHPTIRMVDEVIYLKIGRNEMTADCRFTFKNEGSATTARIGFPDYDSDPYIDPKKGIRSIYKNFRSYVDGKAVKTKLIDSSYDMGWQVKHVTFRKDQTRRIRNTYKIKLGTLSLDGKWSDNQQPMAYCATYVLSTGRSWKGTIGSTKIIVEFEKTSLVKGHIAVREFPATELEDDASLLEKNKGLVFWSGFAKPQVKGRTLTFIRKNWTPKDDGDDLFLKFGIYTRPKSWD